MAKPKIKLLSPSGIEARMVRRTDPGNTYDYHDIPYAQTTESRVWVDPRSASQVRAVWGCASFVARSIAKLPVVVDRIETKGGYQWGEPAPDHPVARMFRQTNEETTTQLFHEMLIMASQLWGDGIAEIEWDWTRTNPVALWFIEPWRVDSHREAGTRRLYHKITNYNGGQVNLYDEDVIRIPNIGLNPGQGLSTIALAAKSIGINIAGDDLQANSLGNGQFPGGIWQYDGRFRNSQQRDRLQKRLDNALRGSRNAGRSPVVDNRMSYQKIGIPARDMEFLSQRKFAVEEICGWFNVPPHKIQHWDQHKYQSVSEANREVRDDTLIPWAVRLESEYQKKLFPKNSSRYRVRIDTFDLARGDPGERGEFYKDLFGLAAITPNYIAAKEKTGPPVENGDRRFIAANNFAPLDRIDDVETLKNQQGTGLANADDAANDSGSEDSGGDQEQSQEQSQEQMAQSNRWVMGYLDELEKGFENAEGYVDKNGSGKTVRELIASTISQTGDARCPG